MISRNMRNIIWRHKTKERRKGKGTRNPDCSMDLSTWIIINASTKRQSRPRNIRIITAFLQVSQDTSFGLASRVVTVSIGRPRRHEQHVGNTSLYSLVLTAAHWSVPSALQHTRIDRTHKDHTDKQGILMPSMLAPSRNDNDVGWCTSTMLNASSCSLTDCWLFTSTPAMFPSNLTAISLTGLRR